MHPLEQHAIRNPDWLALRAGDERLTFSQLYVMAASMASSLHSDYGIRRGSCVATIASNSIGHFVSLHAALLLGAVIAPMNTRLFDAERDSQLQLLKPDLLLVESTPVVPASPRMTTVGELRDRKGTAPVNPGKPSEQQLLSVLFTSGTSGAPKAVPHTWAQHRASAEGSRGKLGSLPEDAWLCIIPLYHIGGLAIRVRSLLYGSAVVLPRDAAAATLARELRGGVSIASLVPTMLHRILETDKTLTGSACPGLRAVLLGGGAASVRLWDEIRKRRLPVLGTYGMTETCSQVCTAPISQAEQFSGTAGTPNQGVEIDIKADDGSLCARGTAGEICIRGPMLTSGYVQNPGLNAGRFEDGWFLTGDVGVIDERGALTVLTRREDMIVSGGENMYPSEIEDVLLRHPMVREAVVVGVPDEEWGQRLAAAVCGDGLDGEELERWCRSQLGGYKTPRIWRVLEDLPRTSSGKTSREAVRALFT